MTDFTQLNVEELEAAGWGDVVCIGSGTARLRKQIQRAIAISDAITKHLGGGKSLEDRAAEQGLDLEVCIERLKELEVAAANAIHGHMCSCGAVFTTADV